MATIVKNIGKQSVHHAPSYSERYKRFLEEAKFNYWGLISMSILIGSCWGGLTVMQILQHDAPIWQMVTAIYITMASNIACIGQASAKWVIRLFTLSAIVNLVFILINNL